MKRNTGAAAAVATALAMVLSLSNVGAAEVQLPPPPQLSAAATPINQLPQLPASGELTFVFSDFSVAIYPGWENCSDGAWSPTLQESYLESLDKKERARLLKPENEPELTKKWLAFAQGPNNTNVCTHYDRFPDRPLTKGVQTNIAFGLNLDDADESKPSSDPYFCPQPNFTNPLGEKGIDNSAYRVLGCSRTYRAPDGTAAEQGLASRYMATGEFTIVMILRGVDSLVKDDDVQVILATSPQQAIVDSQQHFISGASFTVTDNARWRHEIRGRIADGVLTTDAKDLLLQRAINSRAINPRPGAGNDWEWDFERAKIRLAFRPDGSVEGLLAGYDRPVDILRRLIGGGQGSIRNAGTDCASRYITLLKYADGGRDPKTGQCTRVSQTYRIAAVPAFVFDRPPAQAKTASAE